MYKRNSDKCARCDHQRLQHIYCEGACRPGFRCHMDCEKFIEPLFLEKPELLENLNAKMAQSVCVLCGVEKSPDHKCNCTDNMKTKLAITERRLNHALGTVAHLEIELKEAQHFIEQLKNAIHRGN